jgi:Ca-activated chloride channel family protein
VTYDDTIEVLYPASKLTDRQKITDKIDSIEARGSTALYGGVQKGAQEVRKFMSGERVNRIILLSDGQAKVGPRSADALGELGKSLVDEGISVTTLGLGMGYNEDLMSRLAYMSDGNHKFLQNNDEIEYFFTKELGYISSVAAQNVEVTIGCDQGVTPVRMLDVDATINGQTVKAGFNQIYGDHSRYMLLALEVDPTKMGETNSLATVTIHYRDSRTQEPTVIHQRVSVQVSNDKRVIDKSHNHDVDVSVVEQQSTLNSVKALKLRDSNNISEAKKVLRTNIEMLEQQSTALESGVLHKLVESNKADLKNLDTPQWSQQRKMMKDTQTKSSFKGCL